MKVISRINVNFHTESIPGGLVHVPAGIIVDIPDDVANHPLFQPTVDTGDVMVIAEGTDLKGRQVLPGQPPGPTGTPAHSPEDETPEPEDTLGLPVSSEEFQKTSKPAETKPAETKPTTPATPATSAAPATPKK